GEWPRKSTPSGRLGHERAWHLYHLVPLRLAHATTHLAGIAAKRALSASHRCRPLRYRWGVAWNLVVRGSLGVRERDQRVDLYGVARETRPVLGRGHARVRGIHRGLYLERRFP